MHYAKIFYCDIANGAGVRTALFVSGCTHHCKECFNPETWDFDYGEKYTSDIEDTLIKSLAFSYVDGLSILGGEPMEIANQPYIRRLVERVTDTYPNKTIWLYSGYTYEELLDDGSVCHCEHTLPILKCIDILVDGEFMIDKKNISLRFRGSENQRLICVKESLENNSIVLSEYMKTVKG